MTFLARRTQHDLTLLGLGARQTRSGLLSIPTGQHKTRPPSARAASNHPVRTRDDASTTRSRVLVREALAQDTLGLMS